MISISKSILSVDEILSNGVSVNFAGGAGKRFGEFLRIDS